LSAGIGQRESLNGGRRRIGPHQQHPLFILVKEKKLNLQFRLESFNATNTPAFGQPNAVLNSPSAGTITSAGDPRRVQLGLKLLW
jgi:hypothetical protein